MKLLMTHFIGSWLTAKNTDDKRKYQTAKAAVSPLTDLICLSLYHAL